MLTKFHAKKEKKLLKRFFDWPFPPLKLMPTTPPTPPTSSLRVPRGGGGGGGGGVKCPKRWPPTTGS